MIVHWAILVCAGVLVASACSPALPPQGEVGAGSGARSPSQDRALRIMLRNEADNLAAKAAGASSPARTRRSFNAELAIVDGTGAPQPYLAEALPQLNGDSWQVLPDGRMVTTYRLRPSLSWHDGAPLTAEDFVFAWRLYVNPAAAMFIPRPQDLVEDMVTRDPRTLVIHWRTTYPEAGSLTYETLPPLPRHILQPLVTALDAGGRDTFANHPFWTTEYVGAGPFRLVRWEAGYELEGVAFDRHALGRPRIDRLILRIVADENTALTALLAGEFDYAECFVLRFEHTQVLQREWIPSGKGVSLICPSAINNSAVQFRPEFQKSPPLLDIRVRRAMAHAIDRRAIHEGIYDGQGTIVETFVAPEAPYYGDVERAIMRYAYDPRRTEQLMAEAGLARDGAGFFARAGERFRPDYWITAGSESERAAVIQAETWHRAGIDTPMYVVSLAMARDAEARATFPGLIQVGITAAENASEAFVSAQIGTAATRWRGDNRGGWANEEVDRLWDAFNTTLDRAERDRHILAIARLVSEQLPVLTYHPNFRAKAHTSALRGPEIGTPATLSQWNIHAWEFR